ncbi:hypothetical protein OHT59_17390 [Streptomyces sp. NBC_00243]|uniref:hypothetical protein n=1 Tax=Streptomyces sp. NBC_00243 TaxID=2975688 RepID=UPI002DD8B683|nr:hypothetical protein [Streptomyces sp. NBC_00243]WRZ20141.1 hypothetical protein OHT59_17390 [Streptomyces sp. NBC_00243]
MAMDEDDSLRRYGLHPVAADLDEVRGLLTVRTRLEKRAQGDGDTELMKLCCVQLFNAGVLDDVLLIWRAKSASMDADFSIDIQLLCGSGLARTKAYLGSRRLPEAEAALQRLLRCEAGGDFEGFSAASRSAWYATYYAP